MDGDTRKIVSIAVSKKKGTRKLPVDEAYVVEDHGLQEDAHSGPWGRQVSFLAAESIEESRSKGLEVGFGDFAENIATEGIDWKNVPIGSRVKLGESVVVEITQIGKECHQEMCDLLSGRGLHHAQGRGIRTRAEGRVDPIGRFDRVHLGLGGC